MSSSFKIPILLLKTRSQPNDGYQAYLSAADQDVSFEPQFVPVLSHAPNKENLSKLEILLRDGTLKDQYGGMIFTSQRAVEGFSDVVARVDADLTQKPQQTHKPDPDHFDTTPFPLYVVGPATQRTLSPAIPALSRILPHLNPLIAGEQTGNGGALASFILQHYNNLHAQRLFTFYEAPRLPFIPLLGAGGENYSRRRLERDDVRLRKKGLLFLVGEQRRDVIPKTLMGESLREDKVGVEEMEVYSTSVAEGFQEDFRKVVGGLKARVVVVVVFSPQGCEAMLRVLGLLGSDGKVLDSAGRRLDGEGTKYVVATIGPTTRDYLKETFGFEADVCARAPSPQGIGEGVRKLLREKGLV